MSRSVSLQPITRTAFAPYGDLLDCSGAPDKMINQGLCGRYHDRARLEFSTGRAGLSLFKAKCRSLPYSLDLIERHPDGSQAFIPLSADPFLVIVADKPESRPLAFLTAPGQAINLHKGTWHGVLTPLGGPGVFAVIDRIGAGANLEEHVYDTPWNIVR